MKKKYYLKRKKKHLFCLCWYGILIRDGYRQGFNGITTFIDLVL